MIPETLKPSPKDLDLEQSNITRSDLIKPTESSVSSKIQKARKEYPYHAEITRLVNECEKIDSKIEELLQPYQEDRFDESLNRAKKRHGNDESEISQSMKNTYPLAVEIDGRYYEKPDQKTQKEINKLLGERAKIDNNLAGDTNKIFEIFDQCPNLSKRIELDEIKLEKTNYDKINLVFKELRENSLNMFDNDDITRELRKAYDLLESKYGKSFPHTFETIKLNIKKAYQIAIKSERLEKEKRIEKYFPFLVE